MFVFGDRVVCTAADLVRAARCEFAMLRALDAELGTAPDEPAAPPPSAAPGGYDDSRERRLADLRDRYGGALVEIRQPWQNPDDPAARVRALSDAHEATVAALRDGAPVIRGAVFFDGRFTCSCDAVVATGPRYTVHVTAPTPHDRMAAALEAAACADALTAADARSEPVVRLYPPGTTTPLAELLPVYQARRRRVERIVDEQLGELLPVQWGDPRYLACGRCPVCVPELTAARDPLLVAGMTGTARARLREAGASTVERLAGLGSAVPGLPPRTVTALRRQAEIHSRAVDSGGPVYAVLDPVALGALPPASDGDLALTLSVDTAGDPASLEVAGYEGALLSFDAATDGGIEGLLSALRRLFGLIDLRRRTYPELRLYHHTSAVRGTLSRWTGALGVGEEPLDELLRAGAVVDLYPIVRGAVLVATTSYDLARLRPLVGGEGAKTVLCLRDWLLDLATEHDAPPYRNDSVPLGTDLGPSPSSVEAALAEYAATQADPQHPAAAMAAALGYRRRERQALWFAHTDRLSHPVPEWPDAPGVLVAEWGTVDTKWHHSPQRATMRRYLTVTGRIGTGDTGAGIPAPGDTVYTFYDRSVSPGMSAGPGLRATTTATVLGCAVDADFDDTVRLEEHLPAGCAPFDDLPIALAPALPPWDENAEAARESAAQHLLMTLPRIPEGALFDILARRAPRLRGGAVLPEVHGDHAAAVTAAARALDGSYVVVQGPSGTGKNSTLARVLERLVVRDRWRIGIVAQAHSTVENLLDAIVAIGVLPELVAKRNAESVAPEWAVVEAARFPRFLDNAVNGCVIGGLPADFADDAVVPAESLDLLVIADAGRFPLAETAAVAGSARNLLLLGDPAPALSRAGHPAPVGDSVLDWLLDGRNTVPAERGYFLDRTWRMHPRVCEPISRLYYDGRLRSNETVALARTLDGLAPGIGTILVEHRGDATESVAEAREVVRQVRALLGMSWTAGTTTRRLHPHDIFVIAPYGAQVGRIRSMLARAKIEDVLVGTAEKFRGREAAVVLLSMTTSSPADAPHGMSFLLSRGLVRAALSRAMWRAVIIRSPLLTEYLPATPRELAELAGFLSLG